MYKAVDYIIRRSGGVWLVSDARGDKYILTLRISGKAARVSSDNGYYMD